MRGRRILRGTAMFMQNGPLVDLAPLLLAPSRDPGDPDGLGPRQVDQEQRARRIRAQRQGIGFIIIECHSPRRGRTSTRR